MQNKPNLGALRERILVTRALKGSIAALGIFMLAFTIIPALIAEASATDWIGGEVDWGSVFLALDPDKDATDAAIAAAGGTSLTPEQKQAIIDAELAKTDHGDINFGVITPTSRTESNAGTMMVKKKTIGVTTTGKYYTIYISTSSNNNNLNLVRTVDGQTTTHTEHNIPAIAGSWSSLAKMTDTEHPTASWGFAVPGTTIAATGEISTTPIFPVPQLVDTQIYYTSEGSAAAQTYNDTRWAAVPASGSAQQIWKNTTSEIEGFNDGDSFDIYYGILVDSDVLAGVYENNVVYTALASASSLDRVSTNVMHDKYVGGSGDEIHIAFDLTDSTSSVTKNMVHVAMVPHAEMSATWDAVSSTYELSNLEFGDYDQCLVSNLSRPESEQYIELTCNAPYKHEGEEYDFWINVSGYNYDYVSRDKTNDGDAYAAYIYAGLQTEYASTDPRYSSTTGANNHVVQNMQNMTSGICSLTNMWGNTIGIDARVYDHTGTGTPLASTSAASAEIGTFALTDNRDNKTYLVRRLADGNCWMVQNLDLNLADFTSDKTARLTSDNTNLNTKNQWIPDAKMRAKSSVLETTGNIANLSVSDYQFQGDTNFGNEFKWGSVCAEGTGPLSSNPSVACNSIAVANNANSNYARSYNNDDGTHPAYLPGTSNIKGPVSTCAAYTDEQTGGHSECRMASVKGDATLAAGNLTSSNGLDRDTSWQPKLVSNAGGVDTSGSDTFTMRGSMYVGDYYNWYAATAETGEYTTQTTVSDDICPKGWRLPVNDASSDGSWTKLLRTTYGLTGAGYGNGASIAKVMQLPLSIPMSGSYSWTNGTLNYRGFGGLYWSSTADSQPYAYYLYFNYNGYFNPQYGHDKVYGLTVRCVVPSSTANTNLTRSEKFATSGTEQALTIDLAASTVSPTEDNTKVYVVPHHIFADNSYIVAGLNKADYAQCAISNITTGSTSAQITCTMPEIGTSAPSGTIAIAGDNSALAATHTDVTGEYDLWVHIDTADTGTDYVSKYTENATSAPAVIYAGLQSKQNATNGGKEYISQMQDMNSMVCKNTNMWGNIASDSDARIYDYRGNGATVVNPTPLLDAGVDELGTSSFALLDNRDNKTYLVRRLADGNCWMVQNLDLNLADFVGKTDQNGGLTPDNTDLSANRSYWDPSKTAYNAAKAINDTVSNDQTSYFPVISNDKLGTTQNYQFQPKGTSGAGYHWGAKDETGDIVNDSRAEMPRSYDHGWDYVSTTGTTGGTTVTTDTAWNKDHASQYYGDNYNWYAATAETGTWSMTSGVASDSICPKGWKLPSNGASDADSWRNLLYGSYTTNGTTAISSSEAGSQAMRSLPLSIPFAGYYNWISGSASFNAGGGGYFWSSTADSQTSGYYLYFGSSRIDPQNSNVKVFGFTIRCVAKS